MPESMTRRSRPQGTVRALLLLALLVTGHPGSQAGEKAKAGPDLIARALGLRGHRIENLPSCVYKLRNLPDGRMAAVIWRGHWPHPFGGPRAKDDAGTILWSGYKDGTLAAGEKCWFKAVGPRGRPFYSSCKRNGLVLWRDGDKWHKRQFKSQVRVGNVCIGSFTEDSKRRAWFTVTSRAVCVDRDNRVSELSFLPGKETAAERSGVGISEDEKGNLLVYPSMLQARANSHGGTFKGPAPRAWMLPGGDISKAIPVDLPSGACRFSYLYAGYWCALRYRSQLSFWKFADGKFAKVDMWVDDTEADLLKRVELLDSDDWKKREEVTKQIIARHLPLKAKVEELFKSEKRPEVKARLETVLNAWKRKPQAKLAPRFFGPLPGGERLLGAAEVQMVGAKGRYLLAWGLWLPGKPEPEKSMKTCHLVRVAKNAKLEPVLGDVRQACHKWMGVRFTKLPDGRIFTFGGKTARLWNGRSYEEVKYTHPAITPFYRRQYWTYDARGRYYGKSHPGYIRVFNPAGRDASEGYETKVFDCYARGRRDRGDRVWHLLLAEEKKKGYYRPSKCHLVRFEDGQPKRLGEIDLTDQAGKSRTKSKSGIRLDRPVIMPYGPDAAIVADFYRSYLYSAGKLEKFETLDALLVKHRAAIAAGLKAEQKVCRRASLIVADEAGNLWFQAHSRAREIKVVTTEGKVLGAKNWRQWNWSGLLPAGGGVMARTSRAWGVLKVLAGAVKADEHKGGRYYGPDRSWTRPDGTAVLYGMFEMGEGGKVKRLYDADDKSYLSREDLCGWRLSVRVLNPKKVGEAWNSYHLTKGDRKVQMPTKPLQMMASPATGDLYAGLSTGLYRIALPKGSGRARFEEVVPTAVYECGMGDSYQLGGAHNSREHFLDRKGRIWQLSCYQAKVIIPPAKVRAVLTGRK
jgi:hypothetical protein